MACEQVFAEMNVQSSTTVPAKEFTYELGSWTKPQDNGPAQLVDATLVLASAAVPYDTSSNHIVKVTFNLLKPGLNYGWAKNVSGLGIVAQVGNNGTPTPINTINDEYVDMPTDTYKPITRVFILAPNPNAPDGKLHFELVDNTDGPKGGLFLLNAMITVIN